MDIIYQLPLPKEVCSKIFIYACKSPYTDLSAIVLKHVLGFNIYESLVAKGGIVSDDIRNPINFVDMFFNILSPVHINIPFINSSIDKLISRSPTMRIDMRIFL